MTLAKRSHLRYHCAAHRETLTVPSRYGLSVEFIVFQLLQLLLPKPLIRFFLGLVAIPLFRGIMRKFVRNQAIDEELEKDLEQWFRGALLLLIATDNMESTIWGWVREETRNTIWFTAGRLLLAIGVIEGMPDQSLFALIHPGPQNPVLEKGRYFRGLIEYVPKFLRGLVCQHLNRSSPVFAILSVLYSGEAGWVCYGIAIVQYLIIGLVSSKDKALDVLTQFDEAVARQRHDIEIDVNPSEAARKAAEAHLKIMDPNNHGM